MERESKYPKWAPNISQLAFATGWIAAGIIGVSLFNSLPDDKKAKNQTKKDLMIGVIFGGILGTAWTLLPTVQHLVKGGKSA